MRDSDGSYTARSRRQPERREDYTLSRTDVRQVAKVVAAPVQGVPVPMPFGDLSRASVASLAELAAGLGLQSEGARNHRRQGARLVLEQLKTFPGRTWQERWEASGFNDEGCGPVRELFTDKVQQYKATGALKALICARVIHPSLSGFRANTFRHFPMMFQQAQRDDRLDAFFAAVAACRASRRNQYIALFDVCCALATQAIALADLTPEALFQAASEVPLGERFTHEGRCYQRTDSRHDRRWADDPHVPSVRVIDESGQVRNLGLEENGAFWEWAYVEVLRLSGIRVEELVELTHLSIRQYQRPNGEVIALLVIAPSKSDRERVIPMSAELFHVIAVIIRRQTRHGPIRLLSRYDAHERAWSPPMPFLFQRQIGANRRVTSAATVWKTLRARCEALGEADPSFRGVHFTPHDFRRLFATELVNNGLPIHIGAALLGHVNVQTTRGYVAVFAEDLTRHYQDFLARRRQMRPHEEYRPATEQEMTEFEEHFDKRKVELGACGRPYQTPCQHEHACIRCPMLQVNPKMLPRLDELEADLRQRRDRAVSEGWLGEIEGIDLTLRFLADKRNQTSRLTKVTGPIDLGIPTRGSTAT